MRRGGGSSEGARRDPPGAAGTSGVGLSLGGMTGPGLSHGGASPVRRGAMAVGLAVCGCTGGK